MVSDFTQIKKNKSIVIIRESVSTNDYDEKMECYSDRE
jgi:hypothetical protein